MSGPQISEQNLNASRVIVGPKRELVRGNAADFWSLEPVGDEGGIMAGIGGDAMIYTSISNTYTLTLNLLPTSSAVGIILGLAKFGAFDITIEMNDFTFNGRAVLQNRGAMSAGNSPTARVLTLGVVYISGNIDVGTGALFAVGA